MCKESANQSLRIYNAIYRYSKDFFTRTAAPDFHFESRPQTVNKTSFPGAGRLVQPEGLVQDAHGELSILHVDYD